MLPFAEVLFQDFLFSGVVLLIVNGISNLTAAGFVAYIFFRQETFADREKEHLKTADERVNREDTLIVYFSRMGYVRHYAYEMSEKMEITFMQTRLLRLASEEWHLPMEQR